MRPAHLPPIPSAAQYAAAFSAIRTRLSAGRLAMLWAQYHAPERTLTASELAMAAHYRSYHGANLQYGRISLLLRQALGYWEGWRRGALRVVMVHPAGKGWQPRMAVRDARRGCPGANRVELFRACTARHRKRAQRAVTLTVYSPPALVHCAGVASGQV